MTNTNYQRAIDVDVPMARPVKQNTYFGISTRASEIVIICNSLYAIIRFIIYCCEKYNSAPVPILITIAISVVIILMIVYRPLCAIFSANLVIPIYPSTVIGNHSMVTNILGSFQTQLADPTQVQAWHNFTHPSWTPDVTNIFNGIVMTFYETCGNIFKMLEDFDNRFASIESTNTSILRRLTNVEITTEKIQDDVAELKTDVAELKTDVAELKTRMTRLEDRVELMHDEMKTGFAEIKSLLLGNVIIVPCDQ